MDGNTGGNFGSNHTFCDFSPAWPNQLWEQDRPMQEYKGGLWQTGGSDPMSGKGPYDDFEGPTTNSGFWGSDVNPQPKQ
jgi:hypothetical protein